MLKKIKRKKFSFESFFAIGIWENNEFSNNEIWINRLFKNIKSIPNMLAQKLQINKCKEYTKEEQKR